VVETRIIKKYTGWVFAALGIAVIIITALYVNEVYNGQKNLAPLFKNGAEVAQGVQIPSEILNLIGLLVYGILMLSVGTRLWNFGFALIKESKE